VFQTQNFDFESRNFEFETQNFDFESRNFEFVTQNFEFKSRNFEFESRNFDVENITAVALICFRSVASGPTNVMLAREKRAPRLRVRAAVAAPCV